MAGVGLGMGKPERNNSSRYARIGSNQPRNDLATWEDAAQEALWRTVLAVTNAGDAITFGRTRDGGAVSVVILSGDERIRKYARGEEEIDALLTEIRTALEATD